MLKKTIILTTCLLTILIGTQAKGKAGKPIEPPIADTTQVTDSLQQDSIQLPPQEATMVFDRQEYHMGRIWDSHKPATYTFFYCNVGISGLIINRIEATCGCTVLQYPTDSLYYDQSGQIEVAISPCTDKKEFKKGIYVYTNAGTFKLLVSGEFNKPNYQHEDYSAIPTIEEEEKQQLLLNDESTNRGIDESKKKEKSNKKEKRKKKQPTYQITE